MTAFTSAWLMSFLVVLALIMNPARGVIECGDIVPKLISCEPFVLNASPEPSAECCGNTQALDKLAVASVPDRKAICECLTSVFKSFPIDYNRSKQLPQLCNLTIKITDPDINCNQ